jgi:hypothetical protein
MIKILHNLCSSVLSQKRPFFAEFFGEKIDKIITSVPGHTGRSADVVSLEMILMIAYQNASKRHLKKQSVMKKLGQ